MKRLIALLAASAIAGCAGSPEPKPLPLSQQPVRERTLDQAIADGVAYLLKEQRPGGYWGTGVRPLGWDIYASAPGSHRAFKVATTGLCALALRELGTPETLAAAVRAEDWLASDGMALRRCTQDEIYNVWGHTYALQALSLAIRQETDPARKERLMRAGQECVDLLERYSTAWGGWNYYDFAYLTRRPSMESTSFGTAAGLIALKDAEAAGLKVPAPLVKQAVRLVEKCRTLEGTYLYSYDWRYHPMGPINRPQGALGRIQACNDALFECGSKAVTVEDLTKGFHLLFKLQGFLECGRKRPYPHEAYYAVAGYFYYFGHYYAARLLTLVPPAEAPGFATRLSALMRPKQEEDGSWWDFGMWDFHKPYGTAFVLMILNRCRDAGAPRN